jgi:polyhydroxybutyrate depolymerase
VSSVVHLVRAGLLLGSAVLSGGLAAAETPALDVDPSAGCGARETTPPQQFRVSGVEREAIVVVPDDYSADEPHALVFGFHGRTNENAQVRRYFGLERAAALDAIFVYPQGLPDDSGNFTWADPGDPADDLRDYALFDAILETIGEAYCIDRNAVFVVGHSLGATFANSLACARALEVRGLASVAGGIDPVPCTDDLAALLLHNPEDEAVPLSEGERARDHLLTQREALGAAEATSIGGFDCRQYSEDENPLLWCLYSQDFTARGRFYPHQWPDGASETIMRFFRELRD